MMYVLSIDQSTQGTKALLFDETGMLIGRGDKPHKQIINEVGWVEHDPLEIYRNTVMVIKELVQNLGIAKDDIKVLGISNQRETVVVWDRKTGVPVYNAIVWQCARGADICAEIEKGGNAEKIRKATGLRLSPYFSAAKIAWILQNSEPARQLSNEAQLCAGTMDSWLVYKLTNGREFRTDYSNASRTQLFNITDLRWDETICELFGVKTDSLPQLTDSDGFFGDSDLEGYFSAPIPIRCVMGDSHGALFGQECLTKGMIKATYGTGSSIMLNIGGKPVFSEKIVTSIAWRLSGEINYVLEGNINYTGAVVTWLQEIGLLSSLQETEMFCRNANPLDTTYLVPAFSGLATPYWVSEAKASFSGMSRMTGKAELIKAGVDSIAYQIADIIALMREETGLAISELRVDGGVTRNRYLMQLQSDIANVIVCVPTTEEFSGIGAAYGAGLAAGIYRRSEICSNISRKRYNTQMDDATRIERCKGWQKAVSAVILP